jgi:predicted RNA methylase
VNGTTITPQIRDLLTRASADGDLLLLDAQLDRPTYVAVDRVLTTAGGHWNRRRRGHVFPDRPAAEVLADLLTADQVINAKARDGWFATPPGVVARILDLADLTPGVTVLEPSAGTGAIAGPAVAHGAIVDCVEFDQRRAAVLRESHLFRSVVQADFLTVNPAQDLRYDRVLMNPPFARVTGTGWQDAAHITHAITFLHPGGLLVSVASLGVSSHSDRQTRALRDLVRDRGGRIQPLPDKAFAESGTDISTCLVILPAAS